MEENNRNRKSQKIALYILIILLIGIAIGIAIYYLSDIDKGNDKNGSETEKKSETVSYENKNQNERYHVFKLDSFKVPLDYRGDDRFIYDVRMRIAIAYPRGSVSVKTALADLEVTITDKVRILISKMKYEQINTTKKREKLKSLIFDEIRNILKKNNISIDEWNDEPEMKGQEHRWIRYLQFDIERKKID